MRRFRRVGTRTSPSGAPFPSCYYVKKRRRGRKGKSGKYVKPINASSVRRSYLPSRAVSRESRLIWRKNRRQRLSQRKRDEGIRKEQFLSPDFPWMKSRASILLRYSFLYLSWGGERNLTKDFESIDDWSRTTSTDWETTEFSDEDDESGTRIALLHRDSDITVLLRYFRRYNAVFCPRLFGANKSNRQWHLTSYKISKFEKLYIK